MLKKWLVFSLLVIFVISLGGCATARQQKEMEIQGLRNQVQALETQLQSREEEINSLRESLAKATAAKESPRVVKRQVSKQRVIREVKSRPNIRQIQIALKNAGYNPGSIDGRRGKQTRDAIKAFQRANNLVVDGKVGKRTWKLLREYLYKREK